MLVQESSGTGCLLRPGPQQPHVIGQVSSTRNCFHPAEPYIQLDSCRQLLVISQTVSATVAALGISYQCCLLWWFIDFRAGENYWLLPFGSLCSSFWGYGLRPHRGGIEVRSSSDLLSPVNKVQSVFSNKDLLPLRGNQWQQQQSIQFLGVSQTPLTNNLKWGISHAFNWGFIRESMVLEGRIFSPIGITSFQLYMGMHTFVCSICDFR